jgi:oligopeptide/dipeptide ABC transporter ATP-binding protein
VTASSILRLIPDPPGKILGGSIRFAGKDILAMPREELPRMRGNDVAMIFQDPMTSLNPVFTVEKQLGEVLRLRFGMNRRAARARAIEMLEVVGIPDPADRIRSYPHELSGGMKQRVMIAMALLSRPKLLIADEPTTALDVTIQAQILHLIRELQREMGTSVLFITHDMGVIAQMCDEVAVMYAGRVVEHGPIEDVFERSLHPYTRGLLRSVPRRRAGRNAKAELPTIEGIVPSLLDPPRFCRFADRCWKRKSLPIRDQRRCHEADPVLRSYLFGRVACHYPLGAAEDLVEPAATGVEA